MLPIEKTEMGTKITILARGDETEATVVKEPFVTSREKLYLYTTVSIKFRYF